MPVDEVANILHLVKDPRVPGVAKFEIPRTAAFAAHGLQAADCEGSKELGDLALVHQTFVIVDRLADLVKGVGFQGLVGFGGFGLGGGLVKGIEEIGVQEEPPRVDGENQGLSMSTYRIQGGRDGTTALFDHLFLIGYSGMGLLDKDVGWHTGECPFSRFRSAESGASRK